MLVFLFRVSIFAVLTLVTQIGGLAYLAALSVAGATRVTRTLPRFGMFVIFYGAMTVAAGFVAPVFGRVPLSCRAGAADRMVIRSPIFCVLNRNYVTPVMRDLVLALADRMDATFPGTVTVVLDASFPFLDGFPLLPHLSHRDGKELDVAYYYADPKGHFVNGATRSPIGYFAFEQPAVEAELPCKGRRDWFSLRWDLDFLQPLFPDYRLEERRTKAVMRWLTTEGIAKYGVQKVFIEPHLKSALGVTDTHVRFQGCRAARHDDHIHIQIE